jgi:hypothetical protein
VIKNWNNFNNIEKIMELPNVQFTTSLCTLCKGREKYWWPIISKLSSSEWCIMFLCTV